MCPACAKEVTEILAEERRKATVEREETAERVKLMGMWIARALRAEAAGMRMGRDNAGWLGQSLLYVAQWFGWLPERPTGEQCDALYAALDGGSALASGNAPEMNQEKGAAAPRPSSDTEPGDALAGAVRKAWEEWATNTGHPYHGPGCICFQHRVAAALADYESASGERPAGPPDPSKAVLTLDRSLEEK